MPEITLQVEGVLNRCFEVRPTLSLPAGFFFFFLSARNRQCEEEKMGESDCTC